MARCPFCDSHNPPGVTQCRSCGAQLAGDADDDSHERDVAFEEELLALLQSGQKIPAVKLYRERTGTGLKDAKEAVEALQRGEGLPPLPDPASVPEEEIVGLLRAGRKIDAIKLYREQSGNGLAEAKQAVEQLGRDHGIESRSSGCAGLLLSLALVAWVIAYSVL